MQITQVIMSYTPPNFDCATQYEFKSFVTMVTYWIPDLPNIKGISGHLQHSIFIFANGASYA